MTDDVTFDPASPDVDELAGGERLSIIAAGIREQKRLNDRIVRLSLPEKLAWELEVRLPTDGSFIAGLPKHARKHANILHIGEGTAFSAMILARYTVGILHGGEYAVDARADRSSAFADPQLRSQLAARDSVEAVVKLFGGSEAVIAGLGDKVVEELSVDDAEVEDAEEIEDPTAQG